MAVEHNPINIDQKKITKDCKTFCILPWIHLHILPDSRVVPCCVSNFDQELGYLKQQSIQQLINSSRIRKMRTNMLRGLPSKECSRCYEWEKNGDWSLRREMNKKFSHFYNLASQTKDGGYIDNFVMRYFDIRFSNVCNFSCRSCGSYLSSGWQNDERKLNGNSEFPILRLNKNTGGLAAYIDKHLGKVEEFYFAGGEPLVSEEHYEILSKLINLKKTKVRLNYNTNLSILNFGRYKLLDLWNKFKHVSVAASLDDYGLRGEFIRKGQNWRQTEINIKLLKKTCPHVKFSVSPTVSVFNVWHLPDFHKYMARRGFIKINDIHLNILIFPVEYKVQVLPPQFKKEVIKKLERHLQFLIKNGGNKKIILEYQQLISFMNDVDLSNEFSAFIARSKKIDEVRGENFVKICPEFKNYY